MAASASTAFPLSLKRAVLAQSPFLSVSSSSLMTMGEG